MSDEYDNWAALLVRFLRGEITAEEMIDLYWKAVFNPESV